MATRQRAPLAAATAVCQSPGVVSQTAELPMTLVLPPPPSEDLVFKAFFESLDWPPTSFLDHGSDSADSEDIISGKRKAEIIDDPTKRLRASVEDVVEPSSLDELLLSCRRRRKRRKDERRRVLKISYSKLSHIEDAEVFLRRSVLINNTVRRLHAELQRDSSCSAQFHRTSLLSTSSSESCW